MHNVRTEILADDAVPRLAHLLVEVGLDCVGDAALLLELVELVHEGLFCEFKRLFVHVADEYIQLDHK